MCFANLLEDQLQQILAERHSLGTKKVANWSLTAAININISSQPESSAAAITVRQNNSVVVAQEKTTSFLQSVFSNNIARCMAA